MGRGIIGQFSKFYFNRHWTNDEIAPPLKVAGFGRHNLFVNRNDKAGYNEQLGMSTLGFVPTHIIHTRRFTHPATKHQALYGKVLGGVVGLIWFAGISGISR